MRRKWMRYVEGAQREDVSSEVERDDSEGMRCEGWRKEKKKRDPTTEWKRDEEKNRMLTTHVHMRHPFDSSVRSHCVSVALTICVAANISGR